MNRRQGDTLTVFPELARFRAAERWLIRRLRRAIDRADEFAHGWEVRVREDAADVSVPLRVESPRIAGSQGQAVPGVGAVEADEFGDDRIRRRVSRDRQPQRVAPPHAKRRMTAAEFDLDIRQRVLARGAR